MFHHDISKNFMLLHFLVIYTHTLWSFHYILWIGLAFIKSMSYPEFHVLVIVYSVDLQTSSTKICLWFGTPVSPGYAGNSVALSLSWSRIVCLVLTGQSSQLLSAISEPKIIKLLCSNQLNMKFQLLIKTKMLKNKDFSCFRTLILYLSFKKLLKYQQLPIF